MPILGIGNPLLDISITTDEAFLKKYDLVANNAILAEEKHVPMYVEMVKMEGVDYIAGGATQNAMRVAQWILGDKDKTHFFGSVGRDDFSKTLKEKASEDGVEVHYQFNEEHPTGTCAVVVTQGGKCRSLVANLAAANHFTKSHIEIPQNKAIIDGANIFYISGFFLTVSPETIMSVGEHACQQDKTFCMNLSAPFLCEFFKDPMMKAFPYVDILFGNETEVAKFSEVQGFNLTDVKEIALKMAALPKANSKKSRIVIITQGADKVISVKDGVAKEQSVTKLSDEQLIDTNGAGDAFVGGYLSQLASGKCIKDCIQCGIWAATHIIQRSGCTFPSEVTFSKE